MLSGQSLEPSRGDAVAALRTETNGRPIRWFADAGAGRPVITWNFITRDSIGEDFAFLGLTDFQPLTPAQRVGVTMALEHYESIFDLDFRFDPAAGSDAALRFGNGDFDAPGGGLVTVAETVTTFDVRDGELFAASVFFNSEISSNFDMTRGGEGYWTTLHEIGHALGLDHTGPGNGADSEPPDLAPDFDTQQFSVMSYVEHPGVDVDHYPDTALLYDIAALDALYGLRPDHRAGNDVYLLPNDRVTIRTIVDAGGTDTISAANQKFGAVIDLGEATFSSIGPGDALGILPASDNLSIAFGTRIENAIGSPADDVLIGNATGNVLSGRAGDDSLFGSGGGDRLEGNRGHDVLDGGRGFDELSGNRGSDVLAGNRGSDLLDGGIGDNWLEGGRHGDGLFGRAGADYLAGNRGADELRGGPGPDQLFGGRGIDQLFGGRDADVFGYADPGEFGDRIHDFQPALDVIRLVELFAGDEIGLPDAFRSVERGDDLDVLADLTGTGFTRVATVAGLAGFGLEANLVDAGTVDLTLAVVA